MVKGKNKRRNTIVEKRDVRKVKRIKRGLVFGAILVLIICFLVANWIRASLKLPPKFFWLIFLSLFFILFILVDSITTKDANRRQLNISIMLTFLTVIILFGQFYIFSIQTSLMRTQTEILRETNPPYEAHIEIIPDQEDLVIPAWELVNSRDIEKESEQRWAIVDMTVYNFGKMDSQKVFCLVEEEENFFGYLTPHNDLGNIFAGTSNRTRLHISYGVIDDRFLDKPDLVPTGIHEIILKCDCDGCKKLRNFNTTINFCIYHKNQSKECP